MPDMSNIAGYLFIIALVLIAVVYFTGTTSDLAVTYAGVGYLGNVFTGRNAQGQFAGYPANPNQAPVQRR